MSNLWRTRTNKAWVSVISNWLTCMDSLTDPRYLLSCELERELAAAESKVDALEELREAAKAVVWFDWSDNDEDAVRAVERLRALVREQQNKMEPRKEDQKHDAY